MRRTRQRNISFFATIRCRQLWPLPVDATLASVESNRKAKHQKPGSQPIQTAKPRQPAHTQLADQETHTHTQHNTHNDTHTHTQTHTHTHTTHTYTHTHETNTQNETGAERKRKRKRCVN